MRWSLIICILLASCMATARPRRKRSLGYIKSFITNNMFRTNTFVAEPIPSNNENFQLYRIPGFDDILLKVSKSKKTDEKEQEKEKEPEEDKEQKPKKETNHDPVIVKPEIAIIGSYLGTTTEKETLIAIEIAKSLIKSGILSGKRDNWIQETVVPMRPQPVEYEENESVPMVPMKGFVEETRFYVPPVQGNVEQVSIVNPASMYRVEYPSLFVSPEAEARPVLSKYSYKQKGPDADMTYESYDNKDVIVTRTEKEPPLPQFIKVRIAEAATIGANPYLISHPAQINLPFPYVFSKIVNPENVEVPQIVPYLTQRVGMTGPITKFGVVPQSSNNFGGSILVDKNPVLFSKPVETIAGPFMNVQQILRCKENNIDKICPHENNELKTNMGSINTVESVKVLQKSVAKNNEGNYSIVINGPFTNDKENITNDNSKVINQILKNNSANEQILSQYTYKQINHQSNDNYTVVKVGESTLKSDSDVESNHGIPKDFVFIPPTIEDTPQLIALNSHSDKKSEVHKQRNDRIAFTSKLKERKPYKTKNNEHNLKHNPIIVSDSYAEKGDAKMSEAKDFENIKRGDIPGSNF